MLGFLSTLGQLGITLPSFKRHHGRENVPEGAVHHQQQAMQASSVKTVLSSVLTEAEKPEQSELKQKKKKRLSNVKHAALN